MRYGIQYVVDVMAAAGCGAAVWRWVAATCDVRNECVWRAQGAGFASLSLNVVVQSLCYGSWQCLMAGYHLPPLYLCLLSHAMVTGSSIPEVCSLCSRHNCLPL